MNESNAEEPKLIIDEDWKSQVEREREQLRKAQEGGGADPQPEQGTSSGTADIEQPSAVKSPRSSHAATEQGATEHAGQEDKLPPAPPASFPLLVTMLGTQALMAMGQLGHESQSPPRLDYAKHYIDLLGVLEEKTKNNLSSDEAHLLGDWLHQLRLGYVEALKHKK